MAERVAPLVQFVDDPQEESDNSDHGNSLLRSRALCRYPSLPDHLRLQQKFIRIHCIYISRRRMNETAKPAHEGFLNQSLCLGPGLTATQGVMEMAKVVKKYVSFDLRVINSTATLRELLGSIRQHLSVPIGTQLQVSTVMENGDVVKITDDVELSNVIHTHPDEITLRVCKSGRKNFWHFGTMVVSFFDLLTTVLLGANLLNRGTSVGKWLGIAVLVAVALTALLNLSFAFVVLLTGKRESREVAEWVQHCSRSVVVGCVAAVFNLLNLECLWSNMIFAGVNFHCPMPLAVRNLTVRLSLYALVPGEIFPIAASIVDFITSADSEKGNVFNILSLATSVASLALSAIKKVVILLLRDDDDTHSEEGGPSPHRPTVDYATALQRRTVSVLVLELVGIDEAQLRPRALAAVICRFHEECFNVLRRRRGLGLRFTHQHVEVAFNAAREDTDHAANAVRTALQVFDSWGNARAEALTTQGSHDRPVLTVRGALATETCYVGTLGTASRREFQVVGPVWRIARELLALADSLSASLLANELCAANAKEPSLMRPIERIAPPRAAPQYTVYEVFTQHRPEAWRGQRWISMFSELTCGSLERAADELNEYVADAPGDAVAAGLAKRVEGCVQHGKKRYAREVQPVFPDTDPESSSPEHEDLDSTAKSPTTSLALANALLSLSEPHRTRRQSIKPRRRGSIHPVRKPGAGGKKEGEKEKEKEKEGG
eukprot:Sspe_Gene.81089::Locus_51643_Transcript_1_1_Confidence_1.000_Length_2262::g.81089::m.81089